MQKLFGSDDRFLIQRLRSELEAAGIPYLMKNEYVAGAVGELPWHDIQQEVWLIDESWAHQAGKVVESLSGDGRCFCENSDWQCSQCNELNEGAFAICWQCQATKEEPCCHRTAHGCTEES
ncbi:putative signal transducing protein [Salinimonas sediminis]|uniref:DUF2007 domain-containing protein n=1 Tax=Salinimonas sediminis TaxID=2303538 RepID=A0A346NPR1_9ALTE|nr:DUF2007 domain-containing protein [Salinimonas sediminis]AXR07518.1 DUF2007 domain-containing protein [Salinimonas sediminis]